MEQKEKIDPSTKNFGEGVNWRLLSVALIGIIILTQFFDLNFRSLLGSVKDQEASVSRQQADQNLEKMVLPSGGITLPIRWGNLGKEMVEEGVIDAEKFETLYDRRGGLSEDEKQLLYGEDNGSLVINSENSGFLLNLLWAFGLANKNEILEQGPMQDPEYGGAENFASTGGWTLAKGDAMDHYSKYEFVSLSKEQQELVEEVSKNVYRPCCGNSVYFPDCNHGMAMLGLLELMASYGASEEEMYEAALKVNSYWFPDTYLTIAKYFQKRGVGWSDVSPKEVLGSAYSGALGYREILKEVEPIQSRSGGGCGV